MKRLLFLLVVLTFPLVGIVLGQIADQPTFNLIQEIGKPRPQGIRYDPNFDQFAYTDIDSRLLLIEAATLQTRFVLYEQGNYSGYIFNHDGHYLALALDRRVEIWDTQTGKLDLSLEPDGVLRMAGTMRFADDDRLLLFDSVVRAPPELRRSENDTSILPWMWDLAAARGERNSTLPGAVDAYPFFGFRNGLIIGPNDTLIAALPGRLQVIDGRSKDYPVTNELQMNRIETDPMDIWRSVRDDLLYVRPNGQNNLLEVDTRDFSSVNLPLGNQLRLRDLQQVQTTRLSNLARIIGEPNNTGENAVLRLVFGDDYRQYQGYEPITVTLIDILEPVTVGREQMGLLVYTYYTNRQYGIMEFVRPTDIVDMTLSPDNTRLMVRRSSNLQPLEIYNLNTGILEHTYFPAESDPSGLHTLAFNNSGTAIITDFERIDVQTGNSQILDVDYTSGFQQFVFTDDSRSMVTITGDDWRLWDIATGQSIERERLNLRGNIVDSTPDARRYLTQYSTDQGEVFEIVDVGAAARRIITIPPFEDRSTETIVRSDDWQNYLVVYAATPSSSHYPGNEIAIYNMERGKVLFLAGDDLPPPDGHSYRWLDNKTVVISSEYPTNNSQPARIYGLDYDASGIPKCLVNAYPAEWQEFIPIWEQLNVNLRADSLGNLTQRLCANLPSSAGGVIVALTPTRRASYVSDATPYPLAIAGVPTCLTYNFPRQALLYADAWRKMSAGLDDAAKSELEKELCEGLITSVYQLAATATADINQFTRATATPIDSGPVTVDSGFNQRVEVMLVDIETGERQIGAYLPPVNTQARPPLDRILEAFQKEKRFYPSGYVQLSPDGTLLAMTDENGFIDIYQLAMPYEALVADRTATAAAEQEDAPRSLVLPATATRPFDNAGQPRATLTPTVTPTPPLAAVATTTLVENGQTADICPSTALYDVSQPPPEYNTVGRLLVPAYDQQFNGRGMLSLDVATGNVTYDDTLPACGTSAGCQFSFDQDWILLQADTIKVLRADGSDVTVLFPAIEYQSWPPILNWVNLHTLEYGYDGYVPDKEFPVRLARDFDPESGDKTAPFEPPQAPTINALPTYALALQPVIQRYWLMSTDYGNGVGAKYYIYDRQAETADYFARAIGGGLNYQWHPLGQALYYQYPSDPRWYRFDAATGKHEVMGNLPDGMWSRDGRYRVQWMSLSGEEYRNYIQQHKLLPKISMWDSQTGLTRRYCIPESGTSSNGSSMLWSPDNRYLSFRITLPPEGDTWPVLYTPTPQDPTPTPKPTATSDPLESQYQYQKPRTLVLDTQTGNITILTDQIADAVVWTGEAQ